MDYRDAYFCFRHEYYIFSHNSETRKMMTVREVCHLQVVASMQRKTEVPVEHILALAVGAVNLLLGEAYLTVVVLLSLRHHQEVKNTYM
jgi:hypothetical protein